MAAYRALVGNALPQLAHSLEQKGITLDYAAKLIMFSNCVTMYDMKEEVLEKTRESDCNAIPIITHANTVQPVFSIVLQRL